MDDARQASAARPETAELVSADAIASVDVTISREDFGYYNWAMALERPILPFLMYTFILLAFASMLGVFPAGRAFAGAALIPMAGYLLWMRASISRLWRLYPQIRSPRSYAFKAQSLLIRTEKNNVPVSYDSIAKIMTSRRGIYILRKDQSADILPRRAIEDDALLLRFLESKVSEVRASNFL